LDKKSWTRMEKCVINMIRRSFINDATQLFPLSQPMFIQSKVQAVTSLKGTRIAELKLPLTILNGIILLSNVSEISLFIDPLGLVFFFQPAKGLINSRLQVFKAIFFPWKMWLLIQMIKTQISKLINLCFIFSNQFKTVFLNIWVIGIAFYVAMQYSSTILVSKGLEAWFKQLA